jgi:hypothetical protein
MIAMYIEKVPNRNSPPAVLLRESYREGEQVKKRALHNRDMNGGNQNAMP